MLFFRKKQKQVSKEQEQPKMVKAYCVYYYEGYTKYCQYFRSEYRANDCVCNLRIQFSRLNAGWCDVIVDANKTVFSD